ncbi:hypothetical protein [Variovorax ginsengisoli]|uniref:DUF2946 domain-containing protein n=1 Tax=Variovorax ginsengisoli TaxID=363844 RepID=A0ABT9S1S3_9BURK|nr:hypothetical protein [Variovorax ginsengisoli]MDP9898305.1 hypothetical protein [Variovorax ginsengisoli]
MLAVPLQGYAAATMAFCAPTGTPAAAGTTLQPVAQADHGNHGHAAAPDHGAHATHAGHTGTHAQHAETAADVSDGHHAHADGGAAHKCGNCGACHALGLTSALLQFVPHVLPPADLVEPFHPVASVAPRLLDKPPRV